MENLVGEETLFMELSTYEDRGIMIFMGRKKSTPFSIVKDIQVNEDISYMRDYIFEEGVLKELHFDKVANL